MTTEEVNHCLKISGQHVSIDAPFAQEENVSMADILADEKEETPDSALLKDSLKREISRALATLTKRESDVIVFYFGLNGSNPMTLEEIGEVFHLTRERVRQIKERATRRLKYTTRSKILRSYLG